MKVFIENQRFNQWWLYLILAIPLIGILVPFFIPSEKDSSNNSLFGLLITLFILALVYLLIFSIQLKTRIDEKGIYYQFFPFNLKLKFISWEELEQCYCRKYKPLSEYGGWGYRMTIRSGKAMNIRGNWGIQLIFKNGKKLLLGTQKPNELKQVLETYKNKFDQSNSSNFN